MRVFRPQANFRTILEACAAQLSYIALMTPTTDSAPAVSTDYGSPITANDLFVTFELIARPGEAAAVRELMIPTVARARTKPGCKHCVLLEVQSEPRIFTYEIWTNRAALDAHLASGQISELGHQLRALLAQPLVVTYMNAISPG